MYNRLIASLRLPGIRMLFDVWLHNFSMECGSSYAPYVAQRRALAPSHPLFEAGNWRRDLLARENAPMVRFSC